MKSIDRELLVTLGLSPGSANIVMEEIENLRDLEQEADGDNRKLLALIIAERERNRQMVAGKVADDQQHARTMAVISERHVKELSELRQERDEFKADRNKAWSEASDREKTIAQFTNVLRELQAACATNECECHDEPEGDSCGYCLRRSAAHQAAIQLLNRI